MLYIHIGFHKTGTSTIQSFCGQNPVALAHIGINYPEFGRRKYAHFGLTQPLQTRSQNIDMSYWDGLIETLNSNPETDHLLSSETFHIISPRAVACVGSKLQKHAVKIIVYIRPLDKFIPSRYTQQAKIGGFSENFDVFFDKFMTDDVEKLRFATNIGVWADVFGWENIRVRSLDPRSLDGGDLLRDFVSAIGGDWDQIGDLIDGSTESQNVAPGWKCVELMRAAHARFAPKRAAHGVKRTADFKAVRRQAQRVRNQSERVWNQLGFSDARAEYLTQAQWDACNFRYERELEQLNSHLVGPKLPAPSIQSFSPRRFLPGLDSVPEEEREAFFVGLSAALSKGRKAGTVGGAPAGIEPRNERRAARRLRRRSDRMAAQMQETATQSGKLETV